MQPEGKQTRVSLEHRILVLLSLLLAYYLAILSGRAALQPATSILFFLVVQVPDMARRHLGERSSGEHLVAVGWPHSLGMDHFRIYQLCGIIAPGIYIYTVTSEQGIRLIVAAGLNMIRRCKPATPSTHVLEVLLPCSHVAFKRVITHQG